MPGDTSLLHRLLLRLLSNMTVRIQVFGASMTNGGSCIHHKHSPYNGTGVQADELRLAATMSSEATLKQYMGASGRGDAWELWRSCAWPFRFVQRVRYAFPGATVILGNQAANGCGDACSIPFLSLSQMESGVAPDLIFLDFSQQVGAVLHMQMIIRILHLIVPSTQLAILWTGSHEAREPLGGREIDQHAKLARHYSIPMLIYSDAERQYVREGGTLELTWNWTSSTKFWNAHHPPWPTHIYVADLLTRWFNLELHALEACDRAGLEEVRKRQGGAPVLQMKENMTLDTGSSWVRPLLPSSVFSSKQGLTLQAIFLAPLTVHKASKPGSTLPSPNISLDGSWRLYEDRPGKPGWIAQKRGDWLTFPVRFSAKPSLIVSYLRTYSNIGDPEVKVDDKFNLPFLKGLWTRRTPETVNMIYHTGNLKKQMPNAKGTSQHSVSFKLKSGPKFKIILAITC